MKHYRTEWSCSEHADETEVPRVLTFIENSGLSNLGMSPQQQYVFTVIVVWLTLTVHTGSPHILSHSAVRFQFAHFSHLFTSSPSFFSSIGSVWLFFAWHFLIHLKVKFMEGVKKKNTIMSAYPIPKVDLSAMFINHKGNSQYDNNHHYSLKGNRPVFMLCRDSLCCWRSVGWILVNTQFHVERQAHYSQHHQPPRSHTLLPADWSTWWAGFLTSELSLLAFTLAFSLSR